MLVSGTPINSGCGSMIAQYDTDFVQVFSKTGHNAKRKQSARQVATGTSNVHNAGSATTDHPRGVDANVTTGAGYGGESSGAGSVAESMPFQSRQVVFTKEDFARTKPGTVGHDILAFLFCWEGKVVRSEVRIDASLRPHVMRSMLAFQESASDRDGGAGESSETPCEDMAPSPGNGPDTEKKTEVVSRTSYCL